MHEMLIWVGIHDSEKAGGRVKCPAWISEADL
jgi:hypothetical protein